MNWNQPEDEDFKEAKDESSQSTVGKSCQLLMDLDEFGEKELFNSDDLVDAAEVVDKIGDVLDCYHNSGKVLKEILKVGEGVDKPVLGSLC